MTVIERVGFNSGHRSLVRVKCVCGFIFIAREDGIKSKTTTSCGCQKVVRMRQLGLNSRTHGLSRISEYSTWQGMIRRCVDKKHNKFRFYGGRDVTVCKAWRNSFIQFLKDMGRKPHKDYTLDRINPFKGYEPSNCRWASKRVQARNTRKRYRAN